MVSRSGNRFYVYLHIHPETKEVVYVGKGTGGRAWAIGSSSSPSGRGNRTKEHQTWIQGLLNAGYTPADYVVIAAQSLDNRSARKIEAELTEENKNSGAKLFNIQCYGVPQHTVLSPQQIDSVFAMRAQGLTYSTIAERMNTATMTTWRALNGKTKSYGKAA
jgi:hypothetical protein